MLIAVKVLQFFLLFQLFDAARVPFRSIKSVINHNSLKRHQSTTGSGSKIAESSDSSAAGGKIAPAVKTSERTKNTTNTKIDFKNEIYKAAKNAETAANTSSTDCTKNYAPDDANSIIPSAATKKKRKSSSSNDKGSFLSSIVTSYTSDFSLASLLAGVALASAGYYYHENRDLKRQLERSQLLSGEITNFNEESSVVSLSSTKLLKDENFFKEAIKRGNQHLCLLILKKFGSDTCKFFESETGQNLLVKLIEKEMGEVVDVLLEGPEVSKNVLIAIDQVDLESGKSPLLAAIQSKMYSQASRLIELGAKPVIPKGPNNSPKTLAHFVNELNDEPEAQALKTKFIELFDTNKNVK